MNACWLGCPVLAHVTRMWWCGIQCMCVVTACLGANTPGTAHAGTQHEVQNRWKSLYAWPTHLHLPPPANPVPGRAITAAKAPVVKQDYRHAGLRRHHASRADVAVALRMTVCPACHAFKMRDHDEVSCQWFHATHLAVARYGHSCWWVCLADTAFSGSYL